MSQYEAGIIMKKSEDVLSLSSIQFYDVSCRGHYPKKMLKGNRIFTEAEALHILRNPFY